MSYTWITAGIHETVRYWNVIYMNYSRYTQNCQVLKCHIHELQQVHTWNCQVLKYMNYNRYIHETVRYWNVIYMNYSRYTWNCQVLKCHIHELQQVYTWNCQVLKCHIHELQQVYMKLSGIEMSYTWTTAGIYIHEMSHTWPIVGSYGWNNTGNLVALHPYISHVANILKSLKHYLTNSCSVWWVSSLYFWALQFHVIVCHVT